MSGPGLRSVLLSDISSFELPSQKIYSEEDVETWRRSQSYQDYSIFLRRLTESVVGISLPRSDESPLPSQGISNMIALLDVLDKWIDEIPPLDTPQRFGNLAFRTWGKRLEKRSDQLLVDLLPSEYHILIPHIKPYLLTSFGSFIRMDYGTGHETSFALLLLCLTLTRFFSSTLEEARGLVLRVFVRYLYLCWRLQDVYKLEPAGSHGVWGLDDSHFLGYIFGSGQLREQTEIPVSAVLQPSLPPTNLYFMSIMRIHEVKHGPFHEHSSQLHSIAVGVPNWGKVNSGLFKMYEAEVLGKRVVVQHIPLGGLLQWSGGAPGSATVRAFNTGTASSTSPSTRAPWAQGTSDRSMPAMARLNSGRPFASDISLPPWPAGASSTAGTPRPRVTPNHKPNTSQNSMLPPPPK